MLVFIHINKTAGRTVRYILRSSFGVRHCEVEPWHSTWEGPPFSLQDLRRVRRYYPNLASIASHRLRGFVDLEENGYRLKYFTFMRDPLKTSASRFQFNVQYRKKKDLIFEEWIQQDWTRNAQTKMIAGTEDVEKAIQIIEDKNIFVGLAEHFDESILLLKSLMAQNLNIAYRRVNVARDNSIKDRLLSSDETRRLLTEANRSDIALYEYVTDKLYPRYQKEYGPNLDKDVSLYQESRESNFNYLNLTLSRLKQYGLYKPVLYLFRMGLPVA